MFYEGEGFILGGAIPVPPSRCYPCVRCSEAIPPAGLAALPGPGSQATGRGVVVSLSRSQDWWIGDRPSKRIRASVGVAESDLIVHAAHSQQREPKFAQRPLPSPAAIAAGPSPSAALSSVTLCR